MSSLNVSSSPLESIFFSVPNVLCPGFPARDQGIGKGECLVLQRQLVRRFGVLPEWALRRLEQASQPELELRAERILDGDSVDAVCCFRPSNS